MGYFVLADMNLEGPGRLSLSGDISFQTSPALLKKSRSHFARGRALEISMYAVSRVDSSAVALMLEWYRMARASGVEVVFTQLPRALKDLITVFNLETRLPIRE
jgi:phospholipid transport system transporter-binding protein